MMFKKSIQDSSENQSVDRRIAEIQYGNPNFNGLFLQSEYLQTLENAAPEGMDFRYVTIESNGQSILYYFQIINLSTVEIGQIINKQPFSGIVKSVCDLLQSLLFGSKKEKPGYLLVCGNMCLSGPFGIAGKDGNLAARHLFEAIENCTRDLNKSGKVVATIIKDFPESNDPYSTVIRHHRYNKLVMDPVMKMEIRPEWESIDDYLAALSSKYRQRYQQTRKKLNGLLVRDLSAEEMANHFDRINVLYAAVQEKSPVKLVKPDAGYLIGLKKNLEKKVRFRGIFQEDQLVGFLTGIDAGDFYEAHHIGIDYQLNKSHALYLNILYLYIEMAIESGAKKLSFGRTALEMKTTVGAIPESHSAWIKLSNGMLNGLIKYMLPEKPSDDWIPRNPFKS